MSLEVPTTGNLVALFKGKACANCERVWPFFNELAQQYQAQIKTAVVDIQEDMQAAVDHGVLSIPTIIFFKDKKEVNRLNGLVSKNKIEETIKTLLG